MMVILKKPVWAACRLAALFLWFTAVVLPSPSVAYVLEGPHVLQLTAEALGTIATLQVENKLLIYPQTPEAAPAVYDETAIYVMPERFRSDIVSETIRRTHLVFGDTSITVIDGRMSVDPDPFDAYQELLRARTRWRLMRTLNRLGVETAICSLGRVDERVVFVLGARYPDESVSQVAIDKTTFLPVRLLLVDQKSDTAGSRLEIVYRNWEKLQSGWFPMQVQFSMDNRLVREIRVASLRLNTSISVETMDPEVLKASVAANAPETPQEQKQKAVEAIQKGVQDFQKKFE
ncbi:hypothetical protein [uncultured Desulfosarcina sp.]|uniref:hypothetical protein n=1 Tax=uncultured Desulfosarcina sp. TaxID=218289 RepID=UPI0029C60A65|nr:hypothetical protein [uncultured Desulfosarcina sp.]